MTAERGNRLLSSVHILIPWQHYTNCAPCSEKFHNGGNINILILQQLFLRKKKEKKTKRSICIIFCVILR